SGVNVTLRGVAATPQGWIAVGGGGVVLTSADGDTWTRSTSNTTNELFAVTDGIAGPVAVSGADDIIHSPDEGFTWQPATRPA
ncbi:MAG: Photosynthesis system assembly factor, partial [Rubrobacteraceae bacterium]|nr:Photosynthesis system assembly factor [Rubrobacteraceae bacterium]